METTKLRQAFLDYFHKNDHTIVPGSSLVPDNDPTLLFTNAGMVQFKDVFLGEESRDYVRATSSQPCVRAGGKHNDLENVGFTARHHTFFEMLGNFSFGDYFKQEAIYYAWEFVTKVLALPKERLWVTIYKEDQESEDIWLKKVGVSKDRFSLCDKEDNFWAMGDIGPCGPCSEIFYDHGPTVPGGPPGGSEEGDRYVEIWNLVFMQYARDISGNLSPLPKPSIDTGMGLERVAAVVQGVHSNYEIDIFKNLIKNIAKTIKVDDLQHASLRVIADHLRSCAFLIADGVLPANDGRGYVLRRIMRRAIRHGHKLKVKDLFFYKLVQFLIQEMGGVFPKLINSKDMIEKTFKQEETQFANTLDQGLKILENFINNTSGKIITGDIVFQLYDTYGFPVDLTADIAREYKLSLDMDGFNTCMQEQRARARSASQFAINDKKSLITEIKTEFLGYEQLTSEANIVELFKDNKRVEFLQPGERGYVVLDQTPFFAEAGGQIGDTGVLQSDKDIFVVEDTQKFGQAYGHLGYVKTGSIKVGDIITANVDIDRRQEISVNHTSTHLVHKALREVLGNHVMQKGSVVDSRRLRFDFSHTSALTPEQITQVEKIVNQKIRENFKVNVEILPYEQALKKGAMALFSDKYASKVRVVDVGDGYSIELCGGTHIKYTGNIGFFKIISESGVAAGIRRIEAITGNSVLEFIKNNESKLNRLAKLFKSNQDNLEEKANQILKRIKQLEDDIKKMQSQFADNKKDLLNEIKEIKGVKVLSTILPIADIKSLRENVDSLKNKLGTAVIVLSAINEQKVNLVVGVTKNCIDRIRADNLLNHIAKQIDGSGGGRADMAQGGGNNTVKLKGALDSVFGWVENNL